MTARFPYLMKNAGLITFSIGCYDSCCQYFKTYFHHYCKAYMDYCAALTRIAKQLFFMPFLLEKSCYYCFLCYFGTSFSLFKQQTTFMIHFYNTSFLIILLTKSIQLFVLQKRMTLLLLLSVLHEQLLFLLCVLKNCCFSAVMKFHLCCLILFQLDANDNSAD